MSTDTAPERILGWLVRADVLAREAKERRAADKEAKAQALQEPLL